MDAACIQFVIQRWAVADAAAMAAITVCVHTLGIRLTDAHPINFTTTTLPACSLHFLGNALDVAQPAFNVGFYCYDSLHAFCVQHGNGCVVD